MASYNTFPKHYFVWSRKIEGLEDFVQLYKLQKDKYNEREFLVEWKTLLQEEQKEICDTDPLTAYLAITKNEIILLSVGNIFEMDDTVPRLHYNTFKSGFTAGILMVKPKEQHTINSKDGCIYVYICKHNENRGRYITNTNCGRALINQMQISEDFHPPEIVVPGKPYVVLQNSVYFFYATDSSSFIILNKGLSFRCIFDFDILLPMSGYTGRISRSCFKEHEQNCPRFNTSGRLDSILPEKTKMVTPLTMYPVRTPYVPYFPYVPNVDGKRVVENKLVAVEKELVAVEKELENIKKENVRLKAAEKELENIKKEAVRLKAAEKELEDIRKENMRLKAVEKELQQIKDKHLTNSMKLESVETELRNVKVANISLKVAERTLESIKKENTKLKAEKKELEDIRDNFQNEHKAMKIEARKTENIKSENTRLKNILQQVCQLTKDIV